MGSKVPRYDTEEFWRANCGLGGTALAQRHGGPRATWQHRLDRNRERWPHLPWAVQVRRGKPPEPCVDGQPPRPVFTQTAEWWLAAAPDGRRNCELSNKQLTDQHGDVTRVGWSARRMAGKTMFADQVPFVALIPNVTKPQGLPVESACPLPADALRKRLALGGQTLGSLADHFDVAPRRVDEALEYLKARHLLVEESAAGLGLAQTILPPPETYAIDTLRYKRQEFAIGILADTHLGSKYERLDVLNDLFDRFAAAGAENVYVAGNWIDGSGRRFNQHDIYVHGVHAQVANFLDKWPRHLGITTHVLSGDDHEGWFVQDAFTNIGHVLEDEAVRAGRDDIRDLGYMERDVEFVAEGGTSRMRVIHAGGGSAYATSYSVQKIAESYTGGEKPQILIAGHYHKWNYDYPREIHAIQPGCVQRQTPFMRKRRLPAHVGGALLWLTQNERGVFTSVKVEWMAYFDQTFYAFGWSPTDPHKET